MDNNTENQLSPEPSPPKTAKELLQIEIKRTCADLDTCFPAMHEGNELERMLGQARIMDKIMLSMLEDWDGYLSLPKFAIALRAQNQYRQTVLTASIIDRRNRINQERDEKRQRRIGRQEDKEWECMIQKDKADRARKIGLTDIEN